MRLIGKKRTRLGPHPVSVDPRNYRELFTLCQEVWIQADGRIRRWASIPEMEGRYLRVVLLADGETVHNAFFDRSFTP